MKSEFYFRREFLEGRCRELSPERRFLPETVKSTWFDRKFTQNFQKKFDTRTKSNSSSITQFFRFNEVIPVLTSGVILGSTGPAIRYGKFPLR